MKSLRVLAFGLAIGVLAILANPQPAAAGAPGRDASRQSRSAAGRPNLCASRPTQSHRQPSRRPLPRHPIRSTTRIASHRSHHRTKNDGHNGFVGESHEAIAESFASRVGSLPHLRRINLDDLVCSERGPPRAGPQSDAIRVPSPDRRCVPSPAIEPQVVLNLRAENPLDRSSRSQNTRGRSREMLIGLSRTVRHEGTAVHYISPS